jgi:hypothetical protein
VGRPQLRAGVRVHPARRLQLDPQATSFADVPFDRWRELNADGLIVGTVQKVSAGFSVEMRLYNVRTRRRSIRAVYDAASNARFIAHTISDEIHKSQRALNGVARTRLTFDSDRDGERMKGTVQNRSIKENLHLRLRRREPAPRHGRPDAEHRAALVARRPLDRLHVVPARRRESLHLEHFSGHARRSHQGGQGRRELAARVVALTARSSPSAPPATESGDLRRQPRWVGSAPHHQQSEHRHHTNLVAVSTQIRVHVRPQRLAPDLRRRRRRVESLEEDFGIVLRPADLVAGALQRNRVLVAQRPGLRHPGPRPLDRRDQGADLRGGTNESPAFSPNGRHIVFTSTRSGKAQVFTMARDGKNVRQITKAGNNEKPDWSK